MMTPSGTELVEGQIWREIDPRKTKPRYVQIVKLHPGRSFVWIETVVKDFGRWKRAPRTRITDPEILRFNGKRGGYEFVEQAR